jgi:hypothetical protein
MEQNIVEYIMLALQWITTVVGAASIIVAALIKVAKLTPSSKDDEWLSGAERFLASIISLLDKLALNPNKEQARRPR